MASCPRGTHTCSGTRPLRGSGGTGGGEFCPSTEEMQEYIKAIQSCFGGVSLQSYFCGPPGQLQSSSEITPNAHKSDAAQARPRNISSAFARLAEPLASRLSTRPTFQLNLFKDS